MISKRLIHKHVVNSINEMEDAMLVADQPVTDDQANQGPVDMTGIRSAAAQACTSIGELIKQCTTVGMDTSELEGIIDEINDMYGLPGGTSEVGNEDPAQAGVV